MGIKGRIGRCALALAGVCAMATPLPLSAQGLAPASAELTRDQALALEKALAALNFDPGKIDGEIDEKTRAAVRLYQNFAALQPDGAMTPDLVAEILAVSASFTEMRSSRSAEAAPSTPEPAAPAPTAVEPTAPGPAPELASPEPRLPEPKSADLAEADSGAPDRAQTPPTAATPAPSEVTQAEPAQAEPAKAERTEAEPAVPDSKLETARPEPDPQGQATAEVAAPAEPEASEPPPMATEPAPPAISDEQPAAPKQDVAVPAPKPKPAQASKLATLAAPEPEAAPDAKLPEARTSGGFDIGGVISRLAKPAAPAGASNVSAKGRQIARAPATPTKTGRSNDGYAAFRDAFEAAKNGDYEQAVKRYSEAIESKKLTLEHLGDAHFNRGNVLHFLRRYDESIADYSAAIGSQPTFAGAFYNRGFAYQAKGQKQPAIKDFRQARDLGLQRLGVRAPDRPPPLRQ